MGIESVQARVDQIKTEIASRIAAPQTRFQSILDEKISADSSTGTQTTAVGDTASVTGSSALQQMAGNGYASSTTGRYCSKCGVPEMISCYGASYTGAVDTGDGMLEKAAPYMDIIQEASSKYGIPVNVIMGVIKAESDFNPACLSSAGAAGLMQIMPDNAQEFGMTDIYDPYQNIMCGTDEIARHLETYNGDLKLALAAYNTGPGNVAKRGVTSSNSAAYLTIPQSIRDYADRVMRYAGLQTTV